MTLADIRFHTQLYPIIPDLASPNAFDQGAGVDLPPLERGDIAVGSRSVVCAAVIPENGQPIADVIGMADGRLDAALGAEESAGQFGHQFRPRNFR